MEVWYQVLIYPKVFGFAAENAFVTKAPYDYGWMINQSLQDIKPFLVQQKAIVTEIKTNNTFYERDKNDFSG